MPGRYVLNRAKAIKETDERGCGAEGGSAEAYEQRQTEERAQREEQQKRKERAEEERRRALRTLEQLQQLTGKEFEDLIASQFRKDGYTVRQCGGSGDEGIDLVLEIAAEKDVVQCKRWKSDIGFPSRS